MKKAVHLVLLIMFLFMSGLCPVSAVHMKYYSGPVEYRLPDSRELERIRKDRSFKYETEMRQGNNFFDLAVNWLVKNVFSKIFSAKARPVWKIVPYIIMASALVVIIIVIRRGDFFGLFEKKSKISGGVFFDAEEDIHEIDIDSLIKKNFDSGDYRSAVRYRFLKTLRLLSLNGIIAWEKEKTNTDYLHEISSMDRRTSFNRLVRVFEYTWYGNFSIDRDFTEELNLRFNEFDRSIGAADE